MSSPLAENETGALVELIPSALVEIARILLLKFALAGRSCRTLEGTLNWLALPGAVHVNPAPAALEDDDPPTEYPVIWTVPLELAPLHVTWTR
jgi:hypothetical protein